MSDPEEYPLGTEVTGEAWQVVEIVELPIQIRKASCKETSCTAVQVFSHSLFFPVNKMPKLSSSNPNDPWPMTVVTLSRNPVSVKYLLPRAPVLRMEAVG